MSLMKARLIVIVVDTKTLGGLLLFLMSRSYHFHQLDRSLPILSGGSLAVAETVSSGIDRPNHQSCETATSSSKCVRRASPGMLSRRCSRLRKGAIQRRPHRCERDPKPQVIHETLSASVHASCIVQLIGTKESQMPFDKVGTRNETTRKPARA